MLREVCSEITPYQSAGLAGLSHGSLLSAHHDCKFYTITDDRQTLVSLNWGRAKRIRTILSVRRRDLRVLAAGGRSLPHPRVAN